MFLQVVDYKPLGASVPVLGLSNKAVFVGKLRYLAENKIRGKVLSVIYEQYPRLGIFSSFSNMDRRS